MGRTRFAVCPNEGQEELSERTAMTAAEAGLIEDTEVGRIEAWRTEELRRAGYDRKAATTVATRHDVDLHLAVDLLRRGCPPEVALKILL
jgi:hypothetical protein